VPPADPIHPGSARSIGAALLLSGALLLAGCVAAAGVASDVSSTAVDATEKLATTGKAEAFVRASWERTVESVHRAADNLALKTVREKSHPEQRKLVYTDDRGQEITITVIRRTAATSEIRLDVGLFGATGLGQLMLKEIVRDLPASAAATEPKASTNDVD
jgi:predicted small secreted protein